ncbi:MAG: FtsX-like permease family protein [Prolixibacteraceae bacterium]|nr:FtsX-like permease family protein [Prolixibacteraceae bacterium]
MKNIKVLTSIATKNIKRNKSRSRIIILSIMTGTIAGTFISALMTGMYNQKVHDSIYTECGHLQIVSKSYLSDEDINSTFSAKETESILKKYQNPDKKAPIQAFSEQTIILSMAQTARGNAGINLTGIIPEEEKKVSDLYTKIIPGTGNYFSSETTLPEVVIGDKLAEILRIKNYRITEKNLSEMLKNGLNKNIATKLNSLKDIRYTTKKELEKAIKSVTSQKEQEKTISLIRKYSTYYEHRAKITFSFTNTAGKLSFLSCHVGGIFKTSNTFFDQSEVFIRQQDIIKETGLTSDKIHKIKILLNKNLSPDNIKNIKPIEQEIQSSLPGLKVLDIRNTSPDAYTYKLMSLPSTFIIMFIIYLVISFGIANTMTMAVMERIKEFGMLRSIGMSKKEIRYMIMAESIILIAIGALIGIFISLIIIIITSHTGINIFGSSSLESFGMSSLIYPDITSGLFIIIVILIGIVSIVTSIFPINKVLKIKLTNANKGVLS